MQISPAFLLSSSTASPISQPNYQPSSDPSLAPTHLDDLPTHSANKPIRRSKLWVSSLKPLLPSSAHCFGFLSIQALGFFFFFFFCIAWIWLPWCGCSLVGQVSVGLVDFFFFVIGGGGGGGGCGCVWLWLMFIVEYILFYCSWCIILLY